MIVFSLIITSNDVCIKHLEFSYETDTAVIESKIKNRWKHFVFYFLFIQL